MSRKKQKILNAEELLNLIASKQWATTSDMAKLGGKGLNSAAKDRKELHDKLEKQGYKLPRYKVPMGEAVNFYKINITYLKKICNISNNKKDLQGVKPINQIANLP